MVTRTKTKKPTSRPARSLAKEGLTIDDYVVSLPDAPNKPSDKLEDYFAVFFGEKSVGKTTLLNQFPGAHIWQLEPGRRNAAVLQSPIDFLNVSQMEEICQKHGIRREEYATPWKKLCKEVSVASESDRYRIMAFDTTDRLYMLAEADYCFLKERESLHAMKDFGASHKLVNQMIEQLLVPLRRTKGVLGTSHGKTREVELVNDTVEMKCMTAPPKMEELLRSISDMQVYYGYTETGERQFYVREKHNIKASCGIDGHFMFKGRQIASFSGGKTPAEAYKNLKLAFDNKKKPIEYVGDDSSNEETD